MVVRTQGSRFRWMAAAVLLMVAASTQAQQPVAARKPDSAWMQGERDRFQAWLANHPADVLIAPFQANGPGFDPVERTLMAAQLADTLASMSHLTLADPALSARALGEGSRNYDDADLQSLAKRMRARFLVIGSAGHDQQSTFRVQIRVLRVDGSGAWRESGRKVWDALALTDERPPYQMIPALARDIADLLLVKAAPAARKATASVGAPGQLADLQELLGARRAVNVHVAQLLAICYPRTPEPGVERAWIRSLRLAQSAPASADKRLPIARALFHLGRRPAALAMLAAPRSEAEHTLLAVLNGNLLAASARAKKISDPVLRLLAQVEIRDLRLDYETGEPRAEVAMLQAQVPEASDWHPFLLMRLKNEASPWGVEDLHDGLRRFDALLGSGDMVQRGLEELADSKSAVDPTLPLARIALATYDSQIRSVKSAPGHEDDLRWLLLDLLQTQVVTDLLSKGQTSLSARDVPEEARAVLESQGFLLSGHPDFEALYAEMAWREYARWRGKKRASWQDVAVARSRAAYTLSGRVTEAIANSERRAAWTSEIVQQLQPLRVENFWTWPARASHLSSAVTEDRKAMQWYADRASRYAVTEYPLLAWLSDDDLLADRKAGIEKSLEGRFDASPEYTTHRAARLLRANDIQGADMVFRRYVDARLRSMDPYYRYLEMLVSQGRHAEGYRMFLGHPAFEPDADFNRVGLSNITGQAAEFFWDVGKFEFAVPLIERSAGYETYSNVSLRSAAQLATYRRELDRAARQHMEAARRYSDLDALSKYFDLIFALGRADEAWRIYEEVYRDGNGGRMLSSIALHTRQIGWTDQRIADWLSSSRNVALADSTYFYAPRAALRAAIIDREPVDLPGLVARFASPSPYTVNRQSSKILRRDDPAAPPRQRPEVCGPSRYGNGPIGGIAKIVSVDSSLVHFARGYQALSRGQYADSFAALDEAARLFEFFDASCESVSYMLPYLALSAAHTRHTTALREYLRGVKYRDRNVNYNLVLAVFAAFDGKHAEAEAFLEAALNRWTGNPYQALPVEYIYAEVLEKLFVQTKHPGYRKRLVDFVRVRQRVAPADAWAYAMEYRHSKVAADRVAALGMANYLDPRSAMLKSASAAELAAAQEQLQQRNPFLAWRAKTPAQRTQ